MKLSKYFLSAIIIIEAIFIVYDIATYFTKKDSSKTNTVAQVKSLPRLKYNIKEPDLSAESVLSIIHFTNQSAGTDKVLYEKEANMKVPIASITKLFTAASASLLTKKLSPDRLEKVKKLYFPLLIASDNASANSIAETFGTESFLNIMHDLAMRIGATSTTFSNPSGLDVGGGTMSTAHDLVKLGEYLYSYDKEILNISRIKLIKIDNKEYVSTDKLLSYDNLPFDIIGGKTGETKNAKQALFLITESPIPNSILMHVVLRSENRDNDMSTLLTWVKNSYEWR